MRYFLFLFICINTVIFSQPNNSTITGKVMDAVTKQPLIGANIVVLNTHPSLGCSSNIDGNFTIIGVPIGRYAIQCSYIGFETVTIYEILVGTGKDVLLNFELQESHLSTTEVVVTTNINKNKSSNDMAGVSAKSFTVEESRRYAGSLDDPMRAVSSFAGVSGSADVNSNGIVVRGNSPKGILWRLEDVDIPSPNHFSYVGQSAGGTTIFSSQVLGNSDFFTGAFPGEYSNALSGVFDMKFRNGNNRKREYSAQIGISGIDLAAEGPFTSSSEATYLFNYRYSIFGFLQLIDSDMKNKIPSYQDLSFKLNIPTNSLGTFSLFGIGGIARSKYLPDCDSTQISNEDRQRSELNNDMAAAGLSHSLVFGKSTFLKTTISTTYNSVSYKYGYITPNLQIKNSDEVEYKTKRLSIGSYLVSKFSQNHTNKTGIKYSQLFYDVDIKAEDAFTKQFTQFVNDNGNSGLIQAYSASKIGLNEAITINLGISWQQLLLNNHFSFEPRASISYKVATNQSISFGYGLHSQIEDISIYLSKNEWGTRPNEKLDFTKSNHFILGYSSDFDMDKSFKVELYYQSLYSVPVVPGSYYSMLNNPGGYFRDSLSNKGTGKNIGIDVTIEKYLLDDYYYLITASYFQSKYIGGDGIERFSRYNGKFALNLLFGKEFVFSSENILGINLRTSYTGGEYYVPVNLDESIVKNNEILNGNEAYKQNLNPFLYVDLSLTYKINYEKFALSLALQLKNMLNQKPIIGYSYNTVTKAIEENKPMGIIPMINCKIEW